MPKTINRWTMLAALALFAALPARAAESAYEINVILPLSGNSAFLGKTEQQALVLQEKLINDTGGIHGRPVHFVIRDDESSPQVAVQLTNDVVAKNPPLLLGSSLVAMCNAMAPIVQNGPVMYCFSPGIHPPPGSFVYTANVSTLDLAHALVRFFRLKGWTRLALMTSSDATGQDADRGLASVLALPENHDVTVVEHAHFNPTDVSVAAQLATIKAAKPQAFIAWTTGSPVATVFRAIQEIGLDVPVGTTSGNMTHAEMTQFAAFLPKELYIPSAEWPVGDDPRVQLDPAVAAKQKAFYAAYAAAGSSPDEGAGLSWDPTSVLIDALRALPANVTAAQLNAYLQKLQHQPGVNGIYDYVKTPQRGLNLDDTIVTRWNAKSGRWEPVAKPTGVPLG
jgi:branched-chain amino acid transport system substrate-binding protein